MHSNKNQVRKLIASHSKNTTENGTWSSWAVQNRNQENIYLKNWTRAHVHGPAWTMLSSDYLWALLSTTGTEQPISTTPGGQELLPQPTAQVNEKWEEVGGTSLSCSGQLCSFLSLSLRNTWESSYALPLFEGGWRRTQRSNLPPLWHRTQDLRDWGASGEGQLGLKGTELLWKGRCGSWSFTFLCQMLFITADIKL